MKELIMFSAFFVVGCNQNDADRTTTTTGATTTQSTNPSIDLGGDPNDSTIDRITEARCAREIACNNVGANKKWSDATACRRDIRQSTQGDYRASECHVVEANKLRSCIDAIKNEKCDDVFDMTRVVACRKANICKD